MPVVRNLHIGVIFKRVSSSGIPPEAASSSRKRMEEWNVKLVASKAGRLHLEKTKLTVSARRKLKKA